MKQVLTLSALRFSPGGLRAFRTEFTEIFSIKLLEGMSTEDTEKSGLSP
jgi:Asp-tRNA(Asn)/Glu-tRNA(Gln) amidotransferase C subunit